MSRIVNRQSFVFSLNFDGDARPSIIQTNLHLRFQADEMVVKSITYSIEDAFPDVSEGIQIWCNIANDNLIGSFPNKINSTQSPSHHFLVNKFQSGSFVLEFQETFQEYSYSPQPLISSQNFTFGTVCVAIEFIKYENN